MKVIALATTFTRDFLETTEADMIINDFRDIDVATMQRLIEA